MYTYIVCIPYGNKVNPVRHSLRSEFIRTMLHVIRNLGAIAIY